MIRESASGMAVPIRRDAQLLREARHHTDLTYGDMFDLNKKYLASLAHRG